MFIYYGTLLHETSEHSVLDKTLDTVDNIFQWLIHALPQCGSVKLYHILWCTHSPHKHTVRLLNVMSFLL